MRKIILIQGKENVGKTTACWKIYKDLVEELKKANGGKAVEHEFIIPDRGITLQTTSVLSVNELSTVKGVTTYKRINEYNMDFIAILPIKTKYVGIISAGDKIEMMECAVNTCIERKVEIIVMAVRQWVNSAKHFRGEERIGKLLDIEKEKINLTEDSAKDKVAADIVQIIYGNN